MYIEYVLYSYFNSKHVILWDLELEEFKTLICPKPIYLQGKFQAQNL